MHEHITAELLHVHMHWSEKCVEWMARLIRLNHIVVK